MYQDLRVWQKSIELVKEIYLLVEKLPSKENYVLSDQMRRAVISIPSNIAEGSGRSSRDEYKRFLKINSKYAKKKMAQPLQAMPFLVYILIILSIALSR